MENKIFQVKYKTSSKLTSKSKKNLLKQSMFEEYKLKVRHPELLDYEDLKSDNIYMYNKLKHMKSMVKVCERWRYKRIFPKTYLKQNYVIPHNIKNTGLPKIRKTSEEQEDFEKNYPKLGRQIVNSKLLYDSFHKTQTKPHFLEYGQVFDMSWKYETSRCIPGKLSNELMDALGINENQPPPWLYKMQEICLPYYDNIKIPGINEDIPIGCRYGYGPNEWGKAPKTHFNLEELPDKILNLENNQYVSFVYKSDARQANLNFEKIENKVATKSPTVSANNDINKITQSKCTGFDDDNSKHNDVCLKSEEDFEDKNRMMSAEKDSQVSGTNTDDIKNREKKKTGKYLNNKQKLKRFAKF